MYCNYGSLRMQKRKAAANSALPQLGAGHCNVYFSNMAAAVWGMTLSNEHFAKNLNHNSFHHRRRA